MRPSSLLILTGPLTRLQLWTLGTSLLCVTSSLFPLDQLVPSPASEVTLSEFGDLQAFGFFLNLFFFKYTQTYKYIYIYINIYIYTGGRRAEDQ